MKHRGIRVKSNRTKAPVSSKLQHQHGNKPYQAEEKDRYVKQSRTTITNHFSRVLQKNTMHSPTIHVLA